MTNEFKPWFSCDFCGFTLLHKPANAIEMAVGITSHTGACICKACVKDARLLIKTTSKDIPVISLIVQNPKNVG